MPGLLRTKPCSFALLLLLVACQSTSTSQDLHTSTDTQRRVTSSAPGWIGMEARGWQRLDAIKAWLDSSGSQDPMWRNYARLELAKGWLQQAVEDTRTAAIRKRRAEDMLNLVLADTEASTAHRHNARVLLDVITTRGVPAGMQRRRDWGARSPKLRSLNPVGGPWKKITVHHSDEVGALVFDGTLQQSHYALRKIQRSHQEDNGWGDIGYHFLIDGRGRIFEGRTLEWQGAHAGGDNNRQNLGVCLLGDFEKSRPSSQACSALRELLEGLRSQHGISRKKIFLHSEMKSTLCPGRHLAEWVKAYRSGGSLSHAPR